MQNPLRRAIAIGHGLMLTIVLALAAPASATSECTMYNEGTLVSIGGSGASCKECSNSGTMIIVMTIWECEHCENTGIAVSVGTNCFNEHGGYVANVCVGDVCYLDTN